MPEYIKTTFGTLGQLFDGPHATPERRSAGPYFLNIASLDSGRLNLAESDHVSVEDFKTWTRRVTPQLGDLLFSYETRLGQAALMPQGIDACLGRRMALLRPDPSVVNCKFLLYYYLSPPFQQTIKKHTIHGATVPRIGLATMPSWDVEIPDLNTQAAIAEVLGALDDKIAANDRSCSVITMLISTLHRQALSRPGARHLPLFDVFEVDFGEPFKGEHFTGPGVGRPLIRIRDLKTFKSQVWTTESRAREAIIVPGNVLVGMDAEFRATWWLGEAGLLNQRVCRIRGRSTGSAFAAEALRRPLAAIENEKSGTTVIHLNKADLARSLIAVPTPDCLESFEKEAEPLLRAYVAKYAESRKLAHARDQLLPLLMSGKVRVKDAEKIAGDVL